MRSVIKEGEFAFDREEDREDDDPRSNHELCEVGLSSCQPPPPDRLSSAADSVVEFVADVRKDQGKSGRRKRKISCGPMPEAALFRDAESGAREGRRAGKRQVT